MFDRLQKPFLTVETGEAYQPVRLTYDVPQQDKLIALLNTWGCLDKGQTGNAWSWYWKAECDELHFESLEAFRKNTDYPPRLGSITLREGKLYINLPSFKRACMAASFFHRMIDTKTARIYRADFINKVFAVDERLSHGFTELFKEEELESILHQRVEDYQKIRELCERAETAEEALRILAEYTKAEAKKRLPYAERYIFEWDESVDAEMAFLGFYIFLRGRELVAIKRWFGQAGYSLADATDEAIEQVFGHVGLEEE